jgi:hypothetical protein
MAWAACCKRLGERFTKTADRGDADELIEHAALAGRHEIATLADRQIATVSGQGPQR